jgi:hypothetical protein
MSERKRESVCWQNTQATTHTHTHTHTNTHTYIQTHTPTHKHTHINKQTQTQTEKNTIRCMAIFIKEIFKNYIFNVVYYQTYVTDTLSLFYTFES